MAPSATLETSESVSVLDTLMARLEAAQCAFNKKQPVMAVQLLDKFVREIQGHAGSRIDFVVASQLASHAQAIIDSILLMGHKPRLPQATAPATPVHIAAGFDTGQSARAPGSPFGM